MNMAENKYTQKSLEAINGAQALATEHSNQQLEQAHLLSALLKEDNSLIPQLLKKMGKDVPQIAAQVKALVEKGPRVSGAAREQGKIYISQDLDKAITAAAGVSIEPDSPNCVDISYPNFYRTLEGSN